MMHATRLDRAGIRSGVFLALAAVALLAFACRLDMHDQPKYKSYRASEFFSDGMASRIPPEGAVAQGQLREDDLLYRGRLDGAFAAEYPFPVTREVLERGRQRFNIFCAPCHSQSGDGRGMIVRRGMTQPPSLHIRRLREAPPGYIFDVVTNGFGNMYSYSSRIEPRDRWAIIAYIQALQLSRNATPDDVDPADLEKLEEAGQ